MTLESSFEGGAGSGQAFQVEETAWSKNQREASHAPEGVSSWLCRASSVSRVLPVNTEGWYRYDGGEGGKGISERKTILSTDWRKD